MLNSSVEQAERYLHTVFQVWSQSVVLVFNYEPPKQSTCYVPCPYWNSIYTPGRKMVMFKKFKKAISPQPLNGFLQNKDQIVS
jgi:hypothetical protein